MDYSGPEAHVDTTPPIVHGGENEEEIRRLPWGCLPAEQYLIVSHTLIDFINFERNSSRKFLISDFSIAKLGLFGRNLQR